MPNSPQRSVATLAAIGALAASVTVSAQIVRPVGPAAAPSTVGPALPAPGAALISGTAVDTSAVPVPGAALRLRNLKTNLIEKVASAGSTGEFAFAVLPELPYVVEVADTAGRIIAVSDVVVAQAGDVASAVLAVPVRVPPGSGLFANTAGSVMSSAAEMGITVVESAFLPLVSPER